MDALIATLAPGYPPQFTSMGRSNLLLPLNFELVEPLRFPADQEQIARDICEKLHSGDYVVELRVVRRADLAPFTERTNPDGTVRPLSENEGLW